VSSTAASDFKAAANSLMITRPLFASVYLFDVLKKYDLAHIIAACAPRPVYLRPVDGLRRACSEREVATALQPAGEAFSLSGADTNCFHIASLEDAQSIPTWLDEVFNH
jgi:hypothetical protein